MRKKFEIQRGKMLSSVIVSIAGVASLRRHEVKVRLVDRRARVGPRAPAVAAAVAPAGRDVVRPRQGVRAPVASSREAGGRGRAQRRSSRDRAGRRRGDDRVPVRTVGGHHSSGSHRLVRLKRLVCIVT